MDVAERGQVGPHPSRRPCHFRVIEAPAATADQPRCAAQFPRPALSVIQRTAWRSSARSYAAHLSADAGAEREHGRQTMSGNWPASLAFALIVLMCGAAIPAVVAILMIMPHAAQVALA